MAITISSPNRSQQVVINQELALSALVVYKGDIVTVSGITPNGNVWIDYSDGRTTDNLKVANGQGNYIFTANEVINWLDFTDMATSEGNYFVQIQNATPTPILTAPSTATTATNFTVNASVAGNIIATLNGDIANSTPIPVNAGDNTISLPTAGNWVLVLSTQTSGASASVPVVVSDAEEISCPSPIISTPLADITLHEGDSFILTADVTGFTIIEWYRRDVSEDALLGTTTTNTFDLGSATTAIHNNRRYYYKAINNCGNGSQLSAASSRIASTAFANTTYCPNPMVTTPNGIAVTVGEVISIPVAVTGATEYQWKRYLNGNTGATVTVAQTTDTLVFSSATLDENGYYWLSARNVCGGGNSPSAWVDSDLIRVIVTNAPLLQPILTAPSTATTATNFTVNATMAGNIIATLNEDFAHSTPIPVNAGDNTISLPTAGNWVLVLSTQTSGSSKRVNVVVSDGGGNTKTIRAINNNYCSILPANAQVGTGLTAATVTNWTDGVAITISTTIPTGLKLFLRDKTDETTTTEGVLIPPAP